MKKLTVFQIDSFTKTKFKGNPAGVVVNADGLSDTQMQVIARELNNSETAFLFKPNDDSCDGVIRYFTPTMEVPICGHATIAAMYAKAIEEKIENRIFQMKTKVGVLPFEIQKNGNDIKVWMTQGSIDIQEALPTKTQNDLLGFLGLEPDELDSRCPIQIASTGHSKVMIGIKSRETLNNLQPNLSELATLSEIIACNGYYVFTLDSNNSDILCYGRMFAPAIGINEDPVTGNANGPLGAYLIHNNIVETKSDEFRFKSVQGETIGREGIIEVCVSIKNKKPSLVKISGEAVVVFKTIIEAE
ncbi:MAG: PhzF family phenazine biosynthesis protein [Pseudohongiellaceae bacterium]|jgi:PhzF family phenazine biosynthesis protein